MGMLLPWGIHLHPMLAGAAMAMSSVSVVASSLTLRNWERPATIQRKDGLISARSTARTSGEGMLAVVGHGVRSVLDKVRSRSLQDRGYMAAAPISSLDNSPTDAFPYAATRRQSGYGNEGIPLMNQVAR